MKGTSERLGGVGWIGGSRIHSGLPYPSPTGWLCPSSWWCPCIYSCELSLARAGLCIKRVVATTQLRPQVAAIQWLPDGLLKRLAWPVPPSLQEQAAMAPAGASRRPSLASQALIADCKFSRCFEPKTGILVLCPRLVTSLSVRFRGPREQMPSAWMLTCPWVWILFHFSFSLPFGQCYSEHLAFCFWLIVKQTDITESALDTTVLRQC